MREQTIEAAEAGRHVITEKPMATRWHDGKAMVAACDKAGVQLFVVKQNRQNAHHPAAQAGHRPAPVRPDLHGDGERVLEPAAGVLRQRARGGAPGSSTAARS